MQYAVLENFYLHSKGKAFLGSFQFPAMHTNFKPLLFDISNLDRGNIL
jgi:hypothetical protein